MLSTHASATIVMKFADFAEDKRKIFDSQNQPKIVDMLYFELLDDVVKIQINGIDQNDEDDAQAALVALIRPTRAKKSAAEERLLAEFRRAWSPQLFSDLYSASSTTDIKRNIVINIRKEEEKELGEILPKSVNIFVDVEVEYVHAGLILGRSKQSFQLEGNKFIPGDIRCNDPIIKELLMKDKAVCISTLTREKITTAANPAFSDLKTSGFTYKNVEGGEFELWEHFCVCLTRSKMLFGDKVFFDPETHETFSKSPEFEEYLREKATIDGANAEGSYVGIEPKEILMQQLYKFLERKGLNSTEAKSLLGAFPQDEENILNSIKYVVLRLELYKFLADNFGEINAKDFFKYVVPHYNVAANEKAVSALDITSKKLVKTFTGEGDEATDEPRIKAAGEDIPQFYIGSDGNFHLRQVTTDISLQDPLDKLLLDEKKFNFSGVKLYSDVYFDSKGCHFNLDKISAPTADTVKLVEKLYLGTATEAPFIPKAPVIEEAPAVAPVPITISSETTPNIFQRMWNGVKNFVKEHPYLTAFLAIAALSIITAAIIVTTLGAGAVPAGVAFGLGLTGIGSTTAGAAVIGFFSAAAAAVATGATIAATATAAAITTAVVVGLPLIAYGIALGIANVASWLREKAFGKKEEPKKAVGAGSHGMMRDTLEVKPGSSPRPVTPSLEESSTLSTESSAEKEKMPEIDPHIIDDVLAKFTYKLSARADKEVSKERVEALLTESKKSAAEEGEIGYIKFEIAKQFRRKVETLRKEELPPRDLINKIRDLVEEHQKLSHALRTHTITIQTGEKVVWDSGSSNTGMEIVPERKEDRTKTSKAGDLENNFERVLKLLHNLKQEYQESPRPKL